MHKTIEFENVLNCIKWIIKSDMVLPICDIFSKCNFRWSSYLTRQIFMVSGERISFLGLIGNVMKLKKVKALTNVAIISSHGMDKWPLEFSSCGPLWPLAEEYARILTWRGSDTALQCPCHLLHLNASLLDCLNLLSLWMQPPFITFHILVLLLDKNSTVLNYNSLAAMFIV